MKLRVDQVSQHLHSPLKSVYVICGDEPLQVMETGNAVRDAAKVAGCGERLTFNVDAYFAWHELYATMSNLSLFTQQRIIELRFASLKLGKEGGQALVELFEQAIPSDVLILFMPKLDASAQKTQWFKAADNAGVIVSVWPVESQRLPGWIMQRLKNRNIRADQQSVAVLADYVEGNLLAAAQEIEKFSMQGLQHLSVEHVIASVENNARHDSFSLVDSALEGDIRGITQRTASLKETGAEPILVLWALAREIRTMIQLSQALATGQTFASLAQQYRIWSRREKIVQSALQRMNLKGWQSCLARAGVVDRTLKGLEPGNAWDEILRLSLAMAGQQLFREMGV